MKFNVNDRVKVIQGNSSHYKKLGTVVYTYPDNVSHLVKLDSGEQSAFFNHELAAYDAKLEPLIVLAETLNKARLQANAIDDLTIQSQRGVYGQIALSLHDTLEQIIGAGKDDIRYATADRVYDSILDGNSVREALAAVVKP